MINGEWAELHKYLAPDSIKESPGLFVAPQKKILGDEPCRDRRLKKSPKDEHCWRGSQRAVGAPTSRYEISSPAMSPLISATETRSGPPADEGSLKPSPISRRSERKGSLLSMPDAINSVAHKAGYIDRDNEVSSACRPTNRSSGHFFLTAACGWSRLAPSGRLRGRSAGARGLTKYRKSHNDGVFDAYTPEIMRCRRSGIITAFLMPMAAAHHRRLSPGCALRRGAPDRSQAGGTRPDRRHGRPTRGSACARS